MIKSVYSPPNTGTGHEDSLNIGKGQHSDDEEPPKKKGRPSIVGSNHMCSPCILWQQSGCIQKLESYHSGNVMVIPP